ncbi:MAG: dephospho-CoA kinase [Armatimonadota bacterium]
MLRFPPLVVAGLTGGIASGKSTIAALFAELGAVVLDADRLGHEVLAPGEPGLAEVVREFGAGFLTPAGELDRKALGARVFGDRTALAALNRITHPRIAERLRGKLRELQKRPPRSRLVVVEAAVLLEAGWAAQVDRILVVSTQHSSQLDRLTHERGLSAAEAEARIKSQIPLFKRLSHADYVIRGDVPLLQTQAEVREVWSALRELVSPASRRPPTEKSPISHGAQAKPRRRPAS